MKIPIDVNNEIFVELTKKNDDVKCKLICSSPNPHITHTILSNLQKYLKFKKIDEHHYALYNKNDDIILNIDINKLKYKRNQNNLLHTTDIRILANGLTNMYTLEKDNVVHYKPLTDLHTHLTGAYSVDSLIKVGQKHDISYPSLDLERFGVDITQYNILNNQIKINDLSNDDLACLKRNLKLSVFTQETFLNMENIYDNRDPFVKNKDMFKDLLREIAKEYSSMGIKYAELSFAGFLKDPEYLKMVHEVLPEIEKETNVKIRFLCALCRTASNNKNLDNVDKINSLIQSPYIVGADFIGNEVNSTKVFQKELEKLAEIAMKKDNHFHIRVHAGEKDTCIRNVKDALKIIYATHQRLEKENNTKYLMPQVRIGHGLHGVDEETIELAKKMNAIIEFNLSSNLALNNINGIEDVPIKKYIEAGIRVVLGTDGHGLYSTDNISEAYIAFLAGLTQEDFKKIKQTEVEVIKDAIMRTVQEHELDTDKIYNSILYSTNDNTPRYTIEVEKEEKLKVRQDTEKFYEKLKEIGAVIIDENILKDKTPIHIAGSMSIRQHKNHLEIEKVIEKMKSVISTLLNDLDPEKIYFSTGLTTGLMGKILKDEVIHYNKLHQDKPFVLLENTIESFDRSGIKNFNHGDIGYIRVAEGIKNWHEYSVPQTEFVKKQNGIMIFIGGGGNLNDMMQYAYNIGTEMYMMDKIGGATENKGHYMQGHHYRFETAEYLLDLLKKSPKNCDLFNIENFVLDGMYDIYKDLQTEETEYLIEME